MSGELLARVESRVRAEVGELVGDAYFDGFMDRHRPRLRELLANAEAQPTSPTTWAEAVTTGSKLARTLLAVRQPPTRAKARALTAASKAFMTARSTRNTYRWYERNKKHGFLLLEAANSWEPIPQGTDLDLPFAVHWQPDLPLDREHTRGLLRRAVEAIRGSDVPRLTEVLYGPGGRGWPGTTRTWTPSSSATGAPRPMRTGSSSTRSSTNSVIGTGGGS